MSEWTRDSTEPSAAEVDTFLDGPLRELKPVLADSTEPLEDEVRVLLRAPIRRPRSHAPAIGGLVAVAALGLAFVLWPTPDPYGISGPAEVTVRQEGAVSIARQAYGLAAYDVDPVAPSGHFRVEAGEVSVTVLGTAFLVDRQRDAVTVTVREGRVQVDHPDGRAVLSRGESWSSALAVASVEPPSAPARVPTRRVALTVPPTASPDPIVPPEPIPTPPIEEPIVPGPNPSVGAFAKLLERVEAGTRDRPLLVDLAAFARGPHPEPLRREALALEALVGLEVRAPEYGIRVADSWLRENPRHPQRSAILEARATAARVRLRNCGRALPTYRELAETSRGTTRARALAWSGLCALSTGDPGAEDHLRDALEQGVDGALRDQVQSALSTVRPEPEKR